MTHQRQIEARQQNVRRELAARNIQVTGAVSILLNAVFVLAPPSRLAELQSIPGVIGVRPMRRGRRMLNRATGLMNAPAAWNALGGEQNAGAGMKIAILDSGIDQTHPAFQDASLPMPAGFPICTSGHPEDCAYTNNKVIVARSYVRMIAAGSDPSNPAPDSTPDDYSPRDRDGHGTAVASAAAANTNTGVVTFTGMAPKAYLGNYKIYGTDGVNDFPPEDVWIKAIEDVVTDGMDVANFSSGMPALSGALDTGSACGAPTGTPCDPLAAAFEAAVQAGLIITVSAGNQGSIGQAAFPTLDSIASPATAPSVITAGATINSHVFQPSVSVTGANVPANLVGIAGKMSDSIFKPSGSGANQGRLVDVSKLGNDGYASASLPANSLAGSYALIERGLAANGCTFTMKAANAQAAGAVGIIFYMYDATPPLNPEGVTSFLGPAVMISNSGGLALKSYLDANPGAVVLIDTAGVEQDVAVYGTNIGFPFSLAANQLATYSSLGPTPDGAIKPDLVATGGFDLVIVPDPSDFNVPAPSGMYLAAQNYDPNGALFSLNRYAAAQGTSFAAPITAGAAALVKQAHPAYTATQIKSALVNAATTVTTDDFGDAAVDVEWVGAGLLDAGAGVAAAVTAEPSSISFGYLTKGALPITKAITVTNESTSSVTLTAAVTQSTGSPGITVTPSPQTLALAAGASGTLNVMLAGTLGGPGEFSGSVSLKSTSITLQLPYMYLVGNGVPHNVIAQFGTAFGGAPGQDIGSAAILVVDPYGVPVAGGPVSFSISPSGSLTLASVPGKPPCSPNNATAATTCNTDNYGNAYAEIVLGSKTGSSTITATAAGTKVTLNVTTSPLPSITAAGVVNAATFQTPVAPGSYITIFGQNLVNPGELSNSSGDSATLTTTGDLPLVLDGATVSFDVPSAGISVPGYMYFINAGQINLQMPWELQNQTSVQIKVTVDESLFGNVVTVPLANFAPSFFEISPGVVAARDEQYKVISPSHPVQRGHVAQLYASGLGAVTNPPASGSPASSSPLSSTIAHPAVAIGTQPATVLFSGLAPGFPALYQVNVVVPSNLAAGNQTITITIGGQASKASGITVQ